MIDPPAVPASHPGDRAPEARDDALLGAAIRGDGGAFRALLERHGPRVHACALHLTGDGAAAEEVTHDVFLSLLRSGATFRGEASVITWLLRVTLNRARDHMRVERRRASRFDTESTVSDIADVRAGPEEELAARERRDCLADAIGRLPEEMRQVVVLRFAGGLGYDAIATVLGVPSGSVASRLHRALRRIGDHLAERGLTREMF